MSHSSDFLEDFFTTLQQKNIEYCILRNADEVEQGDAHDVDMTVHHERLSDAEAILNQTAHKLGWKLHLKTGTSTDKINIKCYNYYFVDEDNLHIEIIHIDFFPTFAWRGYAMLPNDVLLKGVNKEKLYRTTTPEVEAVCNLFVRLVYSGYIKEKYRPRVLHTFKEQKSEVVPLMSYFLDEPLAKKIYDLVCAEQWESIELLHKPIITCVKKKSKGSRIGYLRYLLNKFQNRSGLIVAFQGTDGSGKSTIISEIQNILKNTFFENTFNYYHWRPGFIISEKKTTDNGTPIVCSEPHALPPYGRMKSFLKMGVYSLDYLLGYWLRVYREATQGHLVVFDRYFYDFYMDKLRYRFTISDIVLDFFKLIVPHPDITFLLIGDAQQIYERKKELPLQEIEKQIQCLIDNKKRFKNVIETNVSQSIQKVAFNVSVNILNSLHARIMRQR